MTRFIGEAVGQRSGRSKGTSAKDLRKEMEDFQKTGRHAELDQAAAAERVPALPERDMNRPHIFLDVRQNNKLLGRLVIEIFEDLIPTTARHLMNRCREGMEDTFKNTSIHKLIPDLAAFGGLSRGYKQHSSTKLKQNGKLHHSQKGALSISLTGAEFAITFAKAITLDSSHQESPGSMLQQQAGCASHKLGLAVVGRVHVGMDILDKLNNTQVDFKDKPAVPVTISSCGLTDAQGTHESVEETAAALAKETETPEQAAARLQADAASVKDALQDALQAGLGQKRKAEEPTKPAAIGKRRYLDALDDASDFDSDSDDAG
ncbi:TPA: hypothetical protein ACH3X2_007927 [Trebouxia sp. C0005]